MANEKTISFRVTDAQFDIILKDAKARHLSVSTLCRESIFPSVGSDAFLSFKKEVLVANQEILYSIGELIKHVRFCSSVIATLYNQLKPDSSEKIQKIHDSIFNEDKKDE